MANARVYPIKEYDSFVADKEIYGFESLPGETFDQLKDFILSNRTKDTDALDLMKLSVRKGVGEIITAQNFVGMIAMQDGTVIEILPKIYSRDEEETPRTKKLLIDMLKTLRTAPYRNLQTTSVDITKLDIFEIFIRMFIEEVFRIDKRGLKCDYQTVRQNENVFKGKLLISNQIRLNYAHNERSFVEYEDYNVNRPENRLIKATLVYLLRKTTSQKNKSDLKILLSRFDQVKVSENIEEDFRNYNPDRNMRDYETVLMWAGVFLRGNSFTAYSGSQIAVALLFPMETLFESYIAAKLAEVMPRADFTVSAQDRTYHLFDSPRQFSMRPDIVIRNRKEKRILILDTKWKILSENKPHYGITQADMYQMYAYHKKYGAESVRLVYPMTERLIPEKPISYASLDGVQVHVEFVDLYNIRGSIEGMAGRMISDS